MFLRPKYQKLLTFLVKYPKKKLSRFSWCFYMESPKSKIMCLLQDLFKQGYTVLALVIFLGKAISFVSGRKGSSGGPCMGDLHDTMGDLPDTMAVKLEGGCQAHRVGYFGSAMICKKLLPEIESKQGGVKTAFFGKCI